jgi:spermidine synthase
MDNPTKNNTITHWLLLCSVLIIAVCGLIYELIAGTLASYVLGDSVTQFSLIIGTYMFSMGIGSYLSKYFNTDLLKWFVQVELLVGFIGGISAPLLFLLFPIINGFQFFLLFIVVIIGTLVGIEIPLLLKILKDKISFSELVSRVFTFDYIGALVASIVFPLLFVPHLGLIRTSLFFGIVNVIIGIVLCFYFQRQIAKVIYMKIAGFVILTFQVAAFALSDDILDLSDQLFYQDKVIHAKSSSYQRIVLTKNKEEIRLFLNGNLQFSSKDEYRYHEALVHPAMTIAESPKSVLVLGGGDGLAIREILKYKYVEEITLVDLDGVMTDLFANHDMLNRLNGYALADKRVNVINADAFIWLKGNKKKYDCVIIDFPDPSSFGLGKLYSNAFYEQLKSAIHAQSVIVIQSTSPLVAPKSFWCVNQTLKYCGYNTLPYHNFVPSFGEWGYILASVGRDLQLPERFEIPTKFINPIVFSYMTTFSNDMLSAEPVEVNKLNNQALVKYFEKEWQQYTDH